MKLEGYVSKKAIRKWLDNYEDFMAMGRSFEEMPHDNRMNDDGIHSFFLNKVMLDHAIEQLPRKEKICCKNRWLRKKPVRYTTNILGITQNEYYKRCSNAIHSIYEQLNGEMIGVKQLLDLINSEGT